MKFAAILTLAVLLRNITGYPPRYAHPRGYVHHRHHQLHGQHSRATSPDLETARVCSQHSHRNGTQAAADGKRDLKRFVQL